MAIDLGYYVATDESDRDGAVFILKRRDLCAEVAPISTHTFAVCRRPPTICEMEGSHGFASLLTHAPAMPGGPVLPPVSL